MANIYQKIKSFLAGQNMFHILYTYLLANVIACLFKFGGATDPLIYILLSPVIALVIGVFVECLDGYFGTKEWEKTGKITNKFDPKDLLFDIIGCVLAILIMLEWFWALGGFN